MQRYKEITVGFHLVILTICASYVPAWRDWWKVYKGWFIVALGPVRLSVMLHPSSLHFGCSTRTVKDS